MMVTVKLFARAKDLAKADEVRVEVPDGATVAQLRRALGEAHLSLAGLLTRCVIAVDAEFANDDDVVHERAEVALIPPVSGG